MDMYKIKFTLLQLEIFRLLSIKAGEKLNQRQIASYLKVTPTAIAKVLPKLEKEEVIKIYRGTTNLNFVELNRDSRKNLEFKRVENIKLIYEAGIIEFLEEKFAGATIILFGSYSRGEDTIKSDIDLAIIGRKEKSLDLKLYEQKLEREIRINFYSELKAIHKELRENICNGIVLVGGIEL